MSNASSFNGLESDLVCLTDDGFCRKLQVLRDVHLVIYVPTVLFTAMIAELIYAGAGNLKEESEVQKILPGILKFATSLSLSLRFWISYWSVLDRTINQEV